MTGDLYSTAILFGSLTVVAIVVLGLAMIVVYHVHKKELERLTSYEINVSATIDEEIPNILEKFVNNIFTDYRLKFLDLQYMETYISDDHQQLIYKEFADICGNRMSPAMMDKLSLFWKREAIAEVLADKIYLTVVNYVAVHNSVKYDNIPTDKQITEKTNA